MSLSKYEKFNDVWELVGKDFDSGIAKSFDEYNKYRTNKLLSEESLTALLIAEDLCEYDPSLFLEYKKKGIVSGIGRVCKRNFCILKKTLIKNWADLLIMTVVISVLVILGFRVWQIYTKIEQSEYRAEKLSIINC